MAYMRLGDLLVASGTITGQQLERALALQKETKQRLGDVLIQNGFITEAQLIDALRVQLGVDFVDLTAISIPVELAQYVPRNIAKKYCVVPVKLVRNSLYLAMSDPLDFVAQDEVKTASRKRIIPMIATRKAVEQAISRLYGNEGTARVIEEMKREAGSSSDVIPAQMAQDTADPQESAPTIRFVNALIERAYTERASDIHLEPQEGEMVVRMRIDGLLRRILTVPADLQNTVISRLKIMGGMNIAEHKIPQDGHAIQSVRGHSLDLRISSMPTVYGEKMVLRLLDKSAQALSKSQLGLEGQDLDNYNALLRNTSGVILLVGPTGSGKSTTMCNMIRDLSREEINIVTLEDPVEYHIPGVSQCQINEKTGMTFASGLRAILRQDPDIIMLGEIRDADTAAMAIRSSLTGHLVFSTIHTNSAWGSVSRLRDMGVHPYLLSGTLILCAAQRLVRLLCPDCKKEAELTESEREQVYGPRPVPSDRKEAEDGAGERISEAAIPVDNVDANRTEPFPPADPRNSTGISASEKTGPQPAGKTEEAAAGLAGNKTPVSSVACCETMRGESYERMPRQDRTHGHLMQKTEQETSVLPGKQDPEAHSHKHYRPVGCERCYYTGYRGRRAIYEVIPIDDELAEAIRESRPDIAPLLEKRGITTLKDSALDLFLSGQTSLEEVLPLLRE
mgnify:CR=1 FL=1